MGPTFKDPLPPGEKDLGAVPKLLQGKYLNLSDSSILLVTEKLIQRDYDLDLTIHPNQLDSTILLMNDSLFIKRDGKVGLQYPVVRLGDSLMFTFRHSDTLFQLGDKGILRKYKGYYFLNTFSDVDMGWAVKKVMFQKGKLTVSSISAQEDLETLKEITESKDSIDPNAQLSLTKKQFKEFIFKEGFSSEEVFKKIK